MSLYTLMAILIFTVLFTIAVVLMGSVWLIIKFTSYEVPPRGRSRRRRRKSAAQCSPQQSKHSSTD